VKFSALALDYDGTIATDGMMSALVREAIGVVRQQGVVVLLVTGRCIDDLRRVAGDLTCFDAVVAENGAVLEHECGFLPVVGMFGAVMGVITDRDVSAALAARHRTPPHVTVEEAMKYPVYTCHSSDTLLTALGTMSQHRVRRLPAVDDRNVLQGVLSMDDVVLASHTPGAATSEDIVETLRAIYRRRSTELTAMSNGG
jgi:CBS domain-containing protein